MKIGGPSVAMRVMAELDGKLGAVGAHGGDLDALPEHLRRGAAEHAGHPGAVTGAQGGRDNEVGHLSPEDGGARVAEGALGGRVKIDKASLVVDRDDVVERDVEDAGEMRLQPRLGGGGGNLREASEAGASRRTGGAGRRVGRTAAVERATCGR